MPAQAYWKQCGGKPGQFCNNLQQEASSALNRGGWQIAAQPLGPYVSVTHHLDNNQPEALLLGLTGLQDNSSTGSPQHVPCLDMLTSLGPSNEDQNWKMLTSVLPFPHLQDLLHLANVIKTQRKNILEPLKLEKTSKII